MNRRTLLAALRTAVTSTGCLSGPTAENDAGPPDDDGPTTATPTESPATTVPPTRSVSMGEAVSVRGTRLTLEYPADDGPARIDRQVEIAG